MKRSGMPARSGQFGRGKPEDNRTQLRRTRLTRKTPISRHPAAPAGLALARVELPRRRKDTGPDRKTRLLVLKRDGYSCVCCGRSVIGQRYSLQHRKRRSQGGTNLPSNLLTVLGDGTTGCHARIDSRVDPHDEARGYTVRSHDDPALVSVMVFSEGGSGVTAWPTDAGEWAFEPPAGAA